MRVKITVAYDGSRFFGFQVQKHTHNTVAGTLYVVLKSLHIHGTITASGRTDRGVHATGQVIHIDLPSFWNDLSKLGSLLNRKLPPSINIKSIVAVTDTFHARYSPRSRSYCYVLSKHPLSVFQSHYAHYEPNIKPHVMAQGLKLFVGTHDFKLYCKEGDRKNTVRTIYDASFHEYQTFFLIRITANGFLRSQIRMIVDALFKLNRNTLSIEDIKAQLEMKKALSKTLANPNGLYLTRVRY